MKIQSQIKSNHFEQCLEAGSKFNRNICLQKDMTRTRLQILASCCHFFLHSSFDFCCDIIHLVNCEVQYSEAMSRLRMLHSLVRNSMQTRRKTQGLTDWGLLFPSFTEYMLDCLLCNRHCGHWGEN